MSPTSGSLLSGESAGDSLLPPSPPTFSKINIIISLITPQQHRKEKEQALKAVTMSAGFQKHTVPTPVFSDFGCVWGGVAITRQTRTVRHPGAGLTGSSCFPCFCSTLSSAIHVLFCNKEDFRGKAHHDRPTVTPPTVSAPGQRSFSGRTGTASRVSRVRSRPSMLRRAGE